MPLSLDDVMSPVRDTVLESPLTHKPLAVLPAALTSPVIVKVLESPPIFIPKQLDPLPEAHVVVMSPFSVMALESAAPLN